MFSPEPIYREVCRLLGPPGHVRPRRDPVLRLELRVRPPALLPPTEPLPLLTPTAAIPVPPVVALLTGRGGRARRAPRREAGRGELLLVFVVVLVVCVAGVLLGKIDQSFSDVRNGVCAERPTLCATPPPSPTP